MFSSSCVLLLTGHCRLATTTICSCVTSFGRLHYLCGLLDSICIKIGVPHSTPAIKITIKLHFWQLCYAPLGAHIYNLNHEQGLNITQQVSCMPVYLSMSKWFLEIMWKITHVAQHLWWLTYMNMKHFWGRNTPVKPQRFSPHKWHRVWKRVQQREKA